MAVKVGEARDYFGYFNPWDGVSGGGSSTALPAVLGARGARAAPLPVPLRVVVFTAGLFAPLWKHELWPVHVPRTPGMMH